MTKDEILAEIASYNDLIADPSVPQDEKDFAKGEIADLQKQLEKATGAPAGKIHVVKLGATQKSVSIPKKPKSAKPEGKKLTDLTTKESVQWRKSTQDELAWTAMQERYPRLQKYDGPKGVKPSQKDKAAARPTYKYKGKTLKELTKEDCDELRKDVKERRQKAAKAEKKSKSKPVIEKIAGNVATAVKQAVKNVSAADIKDNPKVEINKMEAIEKLAKKFLADLRGILGDDYDKESIDGEFKEVHDMIKDLKKKYS